MPKLADPAAGEYMAIMVVFVVWSATPYERTPKCQGKIPILRKNTEHICITFVHGLISPGNSLLIELLFKHIDLFASNSTVFHFVNQFAGVFQLSFPDVAKYIVFEAVINTSLDILLPGRRCPAILQLASR